MVISFLDKAKIAWVKIKWAENLFRDIKLEERGQNSVS